MWWLNLPVYSASFRLQWRTYYIILPWLTTGIIVRASLYNIAKLIMKMNWYMESKTVHKNVLKSLLNCLNLHHNIRNTQRKRGKAFLFYFFFYGISTYGIRSYLYSHTNSYIFIALQYCMKALMQWDIYLWCNCQISKFSEHSQV